VFTLVAGESWQTIDVNFPAKQRTKIVRLYLPADRSPVDIQSIEYSPVRSEEALRRWDFRGRRE